MNGSLRIYLAACAFMSVALASDETQTVEQLRNTADLSARSGQVAGEAAAYESMIARDPSLNSVLGDRLVMLYIEARQPEKAMEWAREIMRTNPDPQAYLAGVYTLMNSFTEARAILEKEIAESKDASRQIVLLWQLADVDEQQNLLPESKKHLERALELSRGTPHEPQAQAHLEAFTLKHAPRDEPLMEQIK